MELSHQDISDLRLALAHRVVQLEDTLDAELDQSEREEIAMQLVRVRELIRRVDGERPAAQKRARN